MFYLSTTVYIKGIKYHFTFVKHKEIKVFKMSSNHFLIVVILSIHNKKNGSNALKPSKINGYRDLT